VALLTFSIVQYILKIILDYIFFQSDQQIEITLYTIYYYIGITISLILALLISGVSFTSLTIIAVATSVGIGLCMQDIVNNFISGIILLIEKPVKPGDRIYVDGKDGFVRKINFRSTLVTTLYKEDLIIPNSQLISKSIVNYVFKNKLASIQCSVGVDYNSDINLVRDTLLEVAENNNAVIKNKLNPPI